MKLKKPRTDEELIAMVVQILRREQEAGLHGQVTVSLKGGRIKSAKTERHELLDTDMAGC